MAAGVTVDGAALADDVGLCAAAAAATTSRAASPLAVVGAHGAVDMAAMKVLVPKKQAAAKEVLESELQQMLLAKVLAKMGACVVASFLVLLRASQALPPATRKVFGEFERFQHHVQRFQIVLSTFY